MAEIHRKRRKRRGKGSKGLKFWILFVAVPVVVVLAVALAGGYIYVKKRSSGKARQGFEKGLIYANLNRHTEAIAEFKKELEKDSQNANIRYHLGISYIKLKEYDKAASEFNTALKIKPNFSKAHLQLAVINLTKAIESRKLGKSELLVLEELLEAEDICREIIEKDPNFLHAYSLLGEIHFSQGLIDDAIIDYKHVLNLDNSFINGHIALARLYMNKGEFDSAKKECDLVLSELEPDNLQVQILLSTIYEQQGEHAKAVASLKQVLEKKPDNVMARTQLGMLLLKMSRYDEAFAEAEHVSKLSSSKTPPAIYFIKGSVLLQRKEYMKSVALLKEAVLRMPKLVEPHYFLALALTGSGRIEEAKTEFKTAVDLAPNFIPAQLGLARLLSSEGWHKETIDLCKNVLSLRPDSVEAMQMLGLAYVKTQDFKSAEVQFEKIRELQPSTGDVNMAYLSLATGQLSKCIRQCEAILKTDPENEKLYDILGLAHVRRGNFDEGITQFKKGVEVNPNSVLTLLNLAKAYVITENNEEAKKSLERIISLNPNELRARVILASLYGKDGDIDKAVEIFEQTLQINPDYIDGYALATLYLLQGRTDESIDLYNKALKLKPDNAIVNMNLAVAHQQKENYTASISYCRKAIELRPEVPSFKLILTNNYAVNGEYSKAQETIESIPSFTNDQKKAYLELLELCQLNREKAKPVMLALNKAVSARQGGLFDLAISECKKAVKVFPENIVPKVILANTYLSTNRNDEAIEIYSEIIKDKPEFASSYYDLGRAYLLTKKQDEAMSMYQDMIGVDSKSVPGRLALARLLVQRGETDKAANMVEDVIELDPDNLMAHSLLGEVNLADEKYEKAEEEFSKMITLRSDTFEGHFNMARMKFAQGDFDKCIEHCKIALQSRPVDVRVHNILGMAYMRKGMLNDAALAFNKIIDINSDFIPAYLNLANINLAANKPDIASLLYKAALKVDPDAVEARLGLGDCYALMGEHARATTEFDSILKKYPNNVNAYISLARSYLPLEDYARAQKAAMNALSIETDNPMARSVLAKIYVKREEVPQAINQLKRVLVKNPKLLNVYDLGILYLDTGDYGNAVITYRKGVENFPENSILWCNLAVAYQMRKDYKSAKEACMKALGIEPDGIIPALSMINVCLARGDFDNARRQLEGMKNVNNIQKHHYGGLIDACMQDGVIAEKISYHLSRALAYTNNRWFDRVLKEYEEITKIIPANTVAYIAQADNLILLGEIDKAIDICKKVAELDPDSTDIYNKLAGLYYRKGEKHNALSQYRKTIDIDQNNYTALLNMGMLLETEGMLEESIAAYKKVININPDLPVAYNNLAWLYASRMQNKMAEALKLAEKAKELAPKNSAVIDTLGWIYYLDGMYDKALSELRTAVRNATWNPTIRYHLGMAYYKKGLHREALTEMERALKISDTFPEAAEAKELIEEIIMRRIKGAGMRIRGATDWKVSMLRLSSYMG